MGPRRPAVFEVGVPDWLEGITACAPPCRGDHVAGWERPRGRWNGMADGHRVGCEPSCLARTLGYKKMENGCGCEVCQLGPTGA